MEEKTDKIKDDKPENQPTDKGVKPNAGVLKKFNALKPVYKTTLFLTAGMGIWLLVVAVQLCGFGKKAPLPLSRNNATVAQSGVGVASDVGALSETSAGEHYVDKIERMFNELKNDMRVKESKTKQLEHKLELLEKRAQDLEQGAEESKKNSGNMINNLTQSLQKNVAQILSGTSASTAPGASAREPMLKGAVMASTPVTIYSSKEESASAAPGQGDLPEEAKRWAYLPAGSYVKCTLLTPVDAPISKDDPMPVALRADTIFYGPNGSTVPLKNCMLIGAAWGDLNTEKAYVEIVKIVQVLEDGNVWEEAGGKSGNRLGWVVDGLHGKTEYRINGILAKGAIASFVAAAADALAMDQTSSTVSGLTGTTTTSVTGQTSKFAAYKGASGFAKTLAQPYLKLLEQSMPIIHIDAGKEVYVFTLKGMEVKGLEAKGESEFGSLY